MSKTKKAFKIIGIILLLGVGYAGFRFGQDTLVLLNNGFLEKTKKQDYVGTAEKNLRVIQTAMTIFQDSEGTFPKSDKWMDSILTRLKTDNLKKGEEEKKLRNPMVETESVYGFAYNSECSEKYVADTPQKGKTVLVFATLKPGRNLSGDPEKIGIKSSNGKLSLAITIDGTIIKN